MRTEARQRFEWGRTFIPDIKQICANYLITEAPKEEDTDRNTDLMVLRAETRRVACRVRRYGYLRDYGHQFTLRTPTEIQKVMAGWGDYLFYGFANETETGLVAYLLGDLYVFRLWHQRETWHGRKPGERRPNGDGTALLAYNITDLPEAFVISRKTGGDTPLPLFDGEG